MTAKAESLAVGRANAGIYDKWYVPRVHKDNPAVIFMTGGANNANYGAGEASHVVDAIVAAGFRVFQPSVPYLFGNALSEGRIEDGLLWAQNNLGVNTDPPIIVGQSNGGVCGLYYARQHAVQCFVGMICPIDLPYIYANDTLGLRSAIGAAWGTTYPAALPSATALSNIGPYLDDLPSQWWEASDDPLAHGLSSFLSTYCGGMYDLRNVGALGHTTTAVQAVDADDAVSFILSNL